MLRADAFAWEGAKTKLRMVILGADGNGRSGRSRSWRAANRALADHGGAFKHLR